MKRRKSSLITKLIVLAVALFATSTMMTMSVQINKAEEQKAGLEDQIEAANLENQRIQDEIEQFAQQDNTEKIAREKLGMVSFGEIVFYDVSN